MKFVCVLFRIVFQVRRVNSLAWSMRVRSVTSQFFESVDDFVNIGSHRPRFLDGHTLCRACDGLETHCTPVKVDLLEPEYPEENEDRPDLPVDTSRGPFKRDLRADGPSVHGQHYDPSKQTPKLKTS